MLYRSINDWGYYAYGPIFSRITHSLGNVTTVNNENCPGRGENIIIGRDLLNSMAQNLIFMQR